MNAMNPATTPVIPENAPFSAAQRAWLNGFLAGLYGGTTDGGAGMSTASSVAEEEDFPWHDPALEMDERLALAEGKPFERKLMAAMAQLDCGQCGYLCQSYAEALASGKETSASLCVPGAKPTSKNGEGAAGRSPGRFHRHRASRRIDRPHRAHRHARARAGCRSADGRGLRQRRAPCGDRPVAVRYDLPTRRLHRHHRAKRPRIGRSLPAKTARRGR